MTTIDEIRSEVEMIRQFRDDSYNNCGFLNSSVSAFLDDENIEHEFVTQRGKIAYGGTSDPHEYIRIPAGEIENINEPIIVDAAFDQFCDENKNDTSRDIHVSFGPSTRLPSILILSPSEVYCDTSLGATELFEAYTRR